MLSWHNMLFPGAFNGHAEAVMLVERRAPASSRDCHCKTWLHFGNAAVRFLALPGLKLHIRHASRRALVAGGLQACQQGRRCLRNSQAVSNHLDAHELKTGVRLSWYHHVGSHAITQSNMLHHGRHQPAQSHVETACGEQQYQVACTCP